MKIPLIHDHHTHISLYAALVDCVDISSCCTLDELYAKLMPQPMGQLNVVLGWDSSRLALIEEHLAPLPPVLVNDRSLHGFLMNAAAREILRDAYGDVVEHYRDEHFRERSAGRLMQMMVAHAGLDGAKVERFLAARQREGIAGVTEMLMTHEVLPELVKNHKMAPALTFYTDPAIYDSFGCDARKRIAGIKIFTDGSLGARTAALSEPYLCGRRGFLNYTDDELMTLFAQSAEWGKQLAVHALGDLAIRQVARVTARLDRMGVRLVQPRMEHAQLIDLASARTIKELGFILSMQPNFAQDSLDYSDRLAARVTRQINPLRMLIDEVGFVPGEDLIFGSDGMPHGAAPALANALFGPYTSQRITLEEFCAGYHGPLSDTGYLDISIDDAKKQVCIHEIVGPDASGMRENL